MRWLVIALVCLLAGCGNVQPGATDTTPRYVFYPSREPNVSDTGLLLDTFTGQMWALRSGYFESIKQIHTP